MLEMELNLNILQLFFWVYLVTGNVYTDIGDISYIMVVHLYSLKLMNFLHVQAEKTWSN